MGKAMTTMTKRKKSKKAKKKTIRIIHQIAKMIRKAKVKVISSTAIIYSKQRMHAAELRMQLFIWCLLFSRALSLENPEI